MRLGEKVWNNSPLPPAQTSTSFIPPVHTPRMNQTRCETDRAPRQPGPPSYQAEVFNPFVGQPAAPGHRHAAGARVLRSARCVGLKGASWGRGSGCLGEACRGAAGEPWVKSWTESGGRAGGLRPGSHPRRALASPRPPWPGAPPRAGSFVSREPVVVAAQDVPGGKVEASPAASSPACPAADDTPTPRCGNENRKCGKDLCIQERAHTSFNRNGPVSLPPKNVQQKERNLVRKFEPEVAFCVLVSSVLPVLGEWPYLQTIPLHSYRPVSLCFPLLYQLPHPILR